MALAAGAALALLVAVLANGSFGVAHKLCRCSDEIFTLYHIIGNAVVGALTLPAVRPMDRQVGFAPLAVVAGACQFVAIQCVFRAIARAGVALATAGFAGAVIAFSLMADLAVFGEAPMRPLLMGVALVLIAVGLAGAGVAQQRAQRPHGGGRCPASSAAEALCGEVTPRATRSVLLTEEDEGGSTYSPRLSTTGGACSSGGRDAQTWPPTPEPGRRSGWRASGTDVGRQSSMSLALRRSVSLALVEASEPLPRVAPDGRAAWLLELVACNVVVGVCVVGANAMENLSPEPLRGVAFAPSFGTGMLCCAPLLPLIFRARHRRLPGTADLGSQTDAAAGLISGAIWGTAFVGVDIAIGQGVEEGTALSVFQASIFVAGVWGVALGELRGRLPVAAFFLACAVLVAGIALETYAAG